MNTTFFLSVILATLAGGVLAGLAVWFLKPSAKPEDSFKLKKFEELSAENKELSAKLQETQHSLIASQQAVGRVAELEKTTDEQKKEIVSLQQKLENTQSALQQAEQEKVKVTERKDALEKMQAEHKENISKLMQEQESKFAALQEKSQAAFKQLAAESLKEQRNELVTKNADIFSPIKEKMVEFTKQLGDFRTESATRHGDLQNVLNKTIELNENLSKEAADLATALKSPKQQGCWGELILENVLASAGLKEGEDYDKQVFFKTEDNTRQLPDFVIHLPNNRHFVIDSKMTLNSYTRWATATDEAEKEQHLQDLVTAIKANIDNLSGKNYKTLLHKNGLDFVFMFIPNEHAFFMALQKDPTLNTYAKNKSIALVTASNLFAVMQIVEQLWRMEKTNQMLDEILKVGSEMHHRVDLFTKKMDDIRDRIAKLQGAYQDAETTLTGQKGIIKSAVNLENLSVKHEKTLKNRLKEEPAAPLLDQEKNSLF